LIQGACAGKQPEWQWLDIDSAVHHCTVGAGIWRWASNDVGDADVVMACAGDVPTLETLATVTLLRAYVPDIRIRVVNVLDLMVLQPQSEHPHGLEDQDFDERFTTGKPVIRQDQRLSAKDGAVARNPTGPLPSAPAPPCQESGKEAG
jgi:xylulose-5-phosphate/fructose-6-phosphate phosphoketolase